VVTKLLRQGIHVLVEKPIAARMEEAEAMVKTARGCGVVLQVGHVERFNPTITALRTRLRAPLFLEIHRISPFPGRGADVDVVLDLMIHDIDLLLEFHKGEIIQVDAVGVPVLTPTYDIVNARFRFDDGCVANVTASRVSAKSLRKIRVFQPDSYLSVDCGKREVVEYRRLPAEPGRDMPRIVGGRLEVEERDTLLDEVRSFIHAARGEGRPVVDGEMGLRCLQVALRVIASIEETLPEGLRDLLGGRGGHG
jgi:predicted dehydrogenase